MSPQINPGLQRQLPLISGIVTPPCCSDHLGVCREISTNPEPVAESHEFRFERWKHVRCLELHDPQVGIEFHLPGV